MTFHRAAAFLVAGCLAFSSIPALALTPESGVVSPAPESGGAVETTDGVVVLPSPAEPAESEPQPDASSKPDGGADSIPESGSTSLPSPDALAPQPDSLSDSSLTVDAQQEELQEPSPDAVTQEETGVSQHADLQQIQEFVARLYRVILGRELDASGLEYWTSALVEGRKSGAEVAFGFAISDEYKAKNKSDDQFLRDMYKAMFDREPDQSGYDYWMGYLNKGVSREYVFRGFAEGVEFEALCRSFGIVRGNVTLAQNRDQNPDVTAFVSRLYQTTLDRRGDELGLNDWTGRLLSGQSTGAQIIDGFFCSNEYKGKGTSEDEYLNDLYHALFDRGPDDSGYQNWLGKLLKGASRRSVMNGFAGSQEFLDLCAGYGVIPGSLSVNELRDQHPDYAAFVYRMYQYLLGRVPGDELNDLVQRLVNGATGDEIVLDFTHSAEFRDRKLTNQEVVSALTHALYGREPYASEVTQYTQLLSTHTRAQLADKMRDTGDFADYCESLGIKGGPNSTLLHGADVSYHQKDVNWTQLKNAGCEFVYLRAAVSTNSGLKEDTRFFEYLAGAKAAGLNVGAYLYFGATNTQEAIEETTFFLNVLKKAEAMGYRFDLPIVLDMEYWKPGMAPGLTVSSLTDIAATALAMIEQNGYYPMLYSYANYLKNSININGPQLSGYDLWVARYGDYPSDYIDPSRISVWQYTSSANGPSYGVGSATIDLNWDYRDMAYVVSSGRMADGGRWNHLDS